MLKITRKEGEKFRISDDVCIILKKVKANSVLVAIDAPPDMSINRQEATKFPGVNSAKCNSSDLM